jgi:hypothetical protein
LGFDMTLIRGSAVAYSAATSGVESVEPSSTTIASQSERDWAIKESSATAKDASPL